MALLQSVKFRHVVFHGERERQTKVINFAAHLEPGMLGSGREADLSGEQASFLGWLFERAGLDVRAYRPETLRRRLPSCLRELHVRTAAQARRRLAADPDLVGPAVAAMLVGVTLFFRD